MNRQEIENKVLEMVGRKLKIPTHLISTEAPFSELGLDSVEAFDILFTFEEEFSISATDENVLRLTSIKELVDLVCELRQKA